MQIAIDAMGTDRHPEVDVAGAVMAARELNVIILLVGQEETIAAELAKHDITGLDIRIVDATDHITMDDKPNEVVRGKPQSSMHIGIDLVKTGNADAFVTAGNTGAALAVAMFGLKRIRGVKRPAITAVGELAEHLVTVVDVGANTDTKLEWLQQFALMGNLYAEQVLEVKQPRVGLLANGTEDTKGDALVREAHPTFRKLPLNFIGNVEPHDLFNGKVDVIVADGYVGNILLKTYEATMSAVGQVLRQGLTVDWRAKLGALLLRPYLRQSLSQLDPTQYGGAPLLGVNGIVIISHGGADATVMRNAIRQAKRAIEADIIDVIRSGLTDVQAESEV